MVYFDDLPIFHTDEDCDEVEDIFSNIQPEDSAARYIVEEACLNNQLHVNIPHRSDLAVVEDQSGGQVIRGTAGLKSNDDEGYAINPIYEIINDATSHRSYFLHFESPPIYDVYDHWEEKRETHTLSPQLYDPEIDKIMYGLELSNPETTANFPERGHK
jgi:hypothetical protein